MLFVLRRFWRIGNLDVFGPVFDNRNQLGSCRRDVLDVYVRNDTQVCAGAESKSVRDVSSFTVRCDGFIAGGEEKIDAPLKVALGIRPVCHNERSFCCLTNFVTVVAALARVFLRWNFNHKDRAVGQVAKAQIVGHCSNYQRVWLCAR